MRQDVFLQKQLRPRTKSIHWQLLVLTMILLGMNAGLAVPPNFQWALPIGGTSYDYAFGMAVDSAGNAVVVGEFRDTVLFGTNVLASSSPLESDAFVVKLGPTGNVVWAKSFGGLNTDSAKAVALDPAGNIYVTGDFKGAANFGTNAFTSSGAEDCYILKLDASGNLLWARKGGGAGHEFGYAIAAGSNFCCVAGTYQSSANFSGNIITSAGSYDAFLARYDAAGNLVWIRSAGGNADDRAFGVALDSQGRCRVTGFFASPVATFWPLTLTNTSALFSDAFVANYDALGNVLWTARIGGTDSERATAIVADSLGNSYIAGQFGSATLTTASGTITNNGGLDVFVAKVDPAGNVLWAKSGGGPNQDVASAIALDSGGNILVTGNHPDAATFGNTTLPNTGLVGTLDGFVAKCDASGNFVWAKNISGTDDESPLGLGLDSQDNIYVVGSFTSSTASFDSIIATNGGNSDIFVARISQEQPLLNPVKLSNGFVISWPAYLQGYALESTANPAGSNWSSVATPPVIIGGQRFVTNPVTGGNQFFRLRKL